MLGQVGLANINFVSSAVPLNARNLLSHFPLALTRLTNAGARLVPIFDEGPFRPKKLPFESWWNEIVLRDTQNHDFSRGYLITIIANQDGGAHVDAALDEPYHRLANENSIGAIEVGPSGEKPILHIEKVYVRQIVWEVLSSIEPEWKKVLGRRPCSCGSRRKTKYCCWKKAKAAI